MRKDSRGQSLLEVVLIMPLMLAIVLNAVNLGYFFFVTVNLTGAVRSAAEYSVIGPGSPGTTVYPTGCNKPASCPAAGPAVTDLLYQDLTGAVANATSANVTVCSPALGTTGGYANCVTCTSSASSSCSGVVNGSSATSHLDPGSVTNGFVLNHVEVKYGFSPLIPGTVFNLTLVSNAYNAGTGQYTFYRRFETRAM